MPDDAIRPDEAIVANGDIAENRGVLADLDEAADCRVALSPGVTGNSDRADSDAAEEIALTTHDRRLANDGAHAVIDDEPRPNVSGRMNFYTRDRLAGISEHRCQVLGTLQGLGRELADRMGEAVVQDRKSVV